jgi:dTDP-4-dehydrorhamnose 3,5-epimerase
MKKKTKNLKMPTLHKGQISIDGRGIVGFNNDLDLSEVKRFYTVQNHKSPFIRAWHGHLKEDKYFLVMNGVAQVIVIPIKKEKKEIVFDSTHPDFKVHKVVLSSAQPSVYYVPAGYANGIQTLTDDTKILVLSNLTFVQARTDDYRMELNKNERDLFEVKEQ